MKIQMLKSITAGLLSAVMLAGCSPNAPSASSSGDSTETASSESQSEPTVTLKIHWHSENRYTLDDSSGNLLPVFQLAADKTNVNVISTANPAAQDSLQEFQLQATNQFPDDIYGGAGMKDGIYTYAMQGAFQPLDDLIESDAPNFKQFLEEHPAVKRSLVASDGHIYMFPHVQDGTVARAYFIRQDWLDKLNLEMPTTVEELEKVLYAFRNDDPNGNGKKDEIPFFNDRYLEMIRAANLFGARVYGNDNLTERICLDENDHFYHAWLDDKFKNALIHLAKWYKDGIIDPEVFTRKANTARQTLFTKENVGGMTHDWIASTSSYNDNTEVKKIAPDFKLVAMLPPSYNGNPGFEEHQRPVCKPDGWAISTHCKNPEAAIRFMDWFYSPEGIIAENFGIEGDTYTMQDGKPKFTEKVLQSGAVNTYLCTNYGAVAHVGYPMDYDYEIQWTNEEGNKAHDLYLNNANYATPTPILNFTAEERSIYDQYLTDLNTYLDEAVQNFITGKTDVNTGWDAYVERAKSLGADEIVKVYESAYQRYKSEE